MSRTPPVAEMTLGDRIAAFLTNGGGTTKETEALLGEVRPAVDLLREHARKARADALDPRRTAAEVTTLRSSADDAEFEAARIERAAAVLATELDAAMAAEAEADRQDRYRTAKAHAEATAARIRRDYPKLAEGLLALIGEVVVVTAEVVRVNGDLPTGAEPLRGPEDLARGFSITTGTAPDVAPWLIAEAVIPSFGPSAWALWPRTVPLHSGQRAGLKRGSPQPTMSPHPGHFWPAADEAATAIAELRAQAEGLRGTAA